MKYIQYNEQKTHGTREFPIEYYYVTDRTLQYIMPLHWHSEFEIVHIISGEFTLYIDNVKYEMNSGDFAFIECGALHRGIPYNCTYECIVFDVNMLRRRNSDSADRYFMPVIKHTYGINCLHRPENDMLSVTVSALFNVLKKEAEFYELEVYSLLFKLFATIYKEKQITENPRNLGNLNQTRIMTDLLDWIDIHYAEPIKLCELASVSGFSEKYLCRFFREYTSKTPIDYINQLRIDNTCRDLLNTDCTITEAAFNNGFNDLSYFSKTFKKYMNMTPKQYIKENCC